MFPENPLKHLLCCFRAPMPQPWKRRLDRNSFPWMNTTLDWSMYVPVLFLSLCLSQSPLLISLHFYVILHVVVFFFLVRQHLLLQLGAAGPVLLSALQGKGVGIQSKWLSVRCFCVCTFICWNKEIFIFSGNHKVYWLKRYFLPNSTPFKLSKAINELLQLVSIVTGWAGSEGWTVLRKAALMRNLEWVMHIKFPVSLRLSKVSMVCRIIMDLVQ